MLYTPLLPGAAAGTLEPRHVVVLLREELRQTELRLGRVTGADPDHDRLDVITLDGREQRIGYEHLIVALRAVSRTFPVPGLVEHAIRDKAGGGRRGWPARFPPGRMPEARPLSLPHPRRVDRTDPLRRGRCPQGR